LHQAIDAMRVGEHGVARVQIAGKEVFVGYSPLGGFGGSLAIVAPIDEVTEQSAAVDSAINSEANRTLAITLATMIAMFAAALGAAAYLNRRALLRPIEALVGGTRAVAAGDVRTRIPVTSTDEPGMLADSFNSMTLQIAPRNDALREEVAERERTAQALSEREQQYRGVFESTTDALIV